MTTYVRRGDLWVPEKRGFISLARNMRRVPVSVAGGGGGGSPPAGVLFHADWSSLTGTSTNALIDYLKPLPFDALETNLTGVLTVISASGHGFPQGMANILQVKRNNIDSYGFCKIGSTSTHWNQLAVGDANYWRVYLRVDIPDSEGNISASSFCDGISGVTCSHHPIQFPHNSGNFEPTNFFNRSDGTVIIDFYTFAQNNAFSKDRAILGTFVDSTTYGSHLPKQTVLRFEWMFRRDSTSGYSIHIRVYDATNEASGGAATLMWSEDGIGASQGAIMDERGPGGQSTLAAFNGLYSASLVDMQSMAIGEEGGYHGYSQDVFFYWGGLCMSNTAWCGPYSGGV